MAVAQPVVAAPPAEPRGARTAPGSFAIGVLVLLSFAVGGLMLYALWEFWPTGAVLKSGAAQPVHAFGIHRTVSLEVRLLVVVAIAGALGGMMHSTRSLAWYVGHKQLKWRWVPYYLVTIVLGAGLASIFYLVIRGGVFSGKATTADANPYGFAALGALVGLFTEQALEMLRHAASDIFAPAPQGADTAPTGTTVGTDGNDGKTTATTSPDTSAADAPTPPSTDTPPGPPTDTTPPPPTGTPPITGTTPPPSTVTPPPPTGTPPMTGTPPPPSTVTPPPTDTAERDRMRQ